MPPSTSSISDLLLSCFIISLDPLVSGLPLWVSHALLLMALRAVQWAKLAQSSVVCGAWCPENEIHSVAAQFHLEVRVTRLLRLPVQSSLF